MIKFAARKKKVFFPPGATQNDASKEKFETKTFFVIIII